MHPTQKYIVEGNYNGPVRVSGSAGTGKTIVALHRAVFLAQNNPDTRILLTTFSETLCDTLRTKLRRLICNQPQLAERIEVYAINTIGLRLYEANQGKIRIASDSEINDLLLASSYEIGEHPFSFNFIKTEWEQVVDAWQLTNWEDYRDVLRLGRKTRLPEKQRVLLWSIFEQVRSTLDAQGMITTAGMFAQLAQHYGADKPSPFDFIVVDEAQDISVPQLKFLAALASEQPESLFFAGDLGQRIFQQPFSWKALGVDIRGRSKTLHINYRTSHQIRMQADKLLDPQLCDVDGITEERRGTISVFNGPPPNIESYESPETEIKAVGQWLKERLDYGIAPDEIGIFVRSVAELPRAQSALDLAGIAYKLLDKKIATADDYVSLSTMHLAKGLEFRVVVVMACDDEVIPLQERIEQVTDDSDLDEVYNTERHLLYVACTRARDHLLVTSVKPASEFLDDLRM